MLTGAGLFVICAELSGPCVRVFEDKQGAIALAEKLPSPACGKNIDVRRFNFIRELPRVKKIDTQLVASEAQHADILMKSLLRPFYISPQVRVGFCRRRVSRGYDERQKRRVPSLSDEKS